MKKILPLVFALLYTFVSWGQILTFEFAGLTGNESSANSNFNDINLTSSTITRGSGLVAFSNADRFNATNWALSSIANAVSGNNYMQFTVTPNSGYQFTVSSIEINLQRSGTGPSMVALRSSVDGYTTNLDTQYAIVDNTSTQSFVFTFAQSNSSVAVTYRIYMYAEATGGSGGIGDFTGNDLVVNGIVSSTTPSPEINVQGLSISIADGDVTPTTIDDTDFGTPLTNANVTHTFTIQNLGTADLILPSNPVTLSTIGNGFTVTQPSLLTIPAGSSTTFTVTFNSATGGTFSNTVNIANNDGDENPYNYSIVATAVVPVPEINISKNTASSDIPSGSAASTGYNTVFSATNIGNNQVKTFYIENEGTANLTIGTVTITGANPGDFIVSAIPSTINVGSTLASSVPFTITFTPQASGLRSATISIVNNDSNENPYTFGVEGNGTCPSYTSSLSPSSGPIGSTVTVTSTLDLSGSNTATINGTPLTLTAISATQVSVVIPSGASSGNIIITNSEGCSISLLFTIITTVISGCEGGSASTPSEIFMSEITDSNTGGLTYIELYNGTGSTINLSTYSIKFFNNGSTTNNGGSVSLPSFSLVDGGIYVVAVGTGGGTCTGITGADASLADLSSGTGGVNFNVGGNDHIKLYNGAVEVDQWGVYSSNSWADGLGLGTEGVDFRRKNTATVPSTTYNDADWIIIDWADCSNNDYSNIGVYDFSVGVPPTVSVQPVVVKNCGSVTITTSGTEGYVGGLGLAYQWYVNASGSGTWSALSNSGVYSGVDTAILTISSTSMLNNYQYYCQIRENTVTCYTATNTVKITDDVSIWDGVSWANGVPTITKKAVLNADYNTSTNGSFDCCTLEVNTSTTLTISSGAYVNVDNDIINNGIINVENSGSIVQVNETDTNSGSSNYTITRYASANNFDYIYWSSPVQNFSITNIPNSHRYFWSTTGLNANGTQGNWVAASGAMGVAMGYIARVTSSVSVIFSGNINNGSLSVSVEKGSDAASINDNYNLIGNPYPSSIDVDAFLYENADPAGPNPVIEGAIRIWTHGTLASNSFTSPFYQNFQNNYNPNDYLIVNGTGSSTGPVSFDGKIASGQGFFVVKEEAASSSVVNFKNSMRGKNYDNSQFFKTTTGETTIETIEKNRIWLNLIAENGGSSRALIGYITGATLAKDVMYDAAIEPSSMYIYSLIGTKKQVIQGRPVPFNSNDLVPVGVKIQTDGNYSIGIAGVDGLFANNSQNIYLEDTQLNLIHNIRQTPYTFTSLAGEYNDRFILRYTNASLSNSNFGIESDFVIAVNEKVLIQSSENIKSVTVFDVLGRILFTQENINVTTTILEKLRPTKEVIIVKTSLDSGKMVSKKMVY